MRKPVILILLLLCLSTRGSYALDITVSDYIRSFLNSPDAIEAKRALNADFMANVKDFGAVGDGLTDDTAAIQAANNSLARPGARGTKKLFFPEGVYLYSDNLTVGDDIEWVGEEYSFWAAHSNWQDGSILQCHKDNVSILLSPDGYGKLTSLVFDAAGTGPIVVLQGPGNMIRGCAFKGKQYAIYLDNADSSEYAESITENFFYDQTSHCIYATNWNAGMAHWSIERNTFQKEYEGAGSAIVITGTGGPRNLRLRDNYFAGFRESGKYIVDLTGVVNCVVLEITSNIFENASGSDTMHGIGINVCTKGLITGNSFYDCNYPMYLTSPGGSMIMLNYYSTCLNKPVITGDAGGNIIIEGTDFSDTNATVWNDSGINPAYAASNLWPFNGKAAAASSSRDTAAINDVQSVTVADNANPSPASAKITPAANTIYITCNDPQGCLCTLSGEGIASGRSVMIWNVGAAFNVIFADNPGVQETNRNAKQKLGPRDGIRFDYVNDAWLQNGRLSNN